MLTKKEFMEVSRAQLGSMRSQYKPKYKAERQWRALNAAATVTEKVG